MSAAAALLLLAGSLLVALGAASRAESRRDKAARLLYIAMGYIYMFLGVVLESP